MLQASLKKPAEVFSGTFSKDRGSHGFPAEDNRSLHTNVDFLERLNIHRVLRNIRINREIPVFNEGCTENRARMRDIESQGNGPLLLCEWRCSVDL
jgi:hypothetical protein